MAKKPDAKEYTHNAPSLLSAFLSRFTLFSTIFRNFQTVDANDG